jgi:hypothetical protein
VIERSREFGELGALGWSEQFAGRHGRQRTVIQLSQKTAHLLRQRYPGHSQPNDDDRHP